MAAARHLFVDRGYAATTIADIADDAGVAVQTIYSSVGTKPELLVALTQSAIAGANVQELSHAGDTATEPLEIPRFGARLRRQLMEEGGDVIRLVMETAPAEPEVDVVWQQLVSYSRQGIGGSVKRLRELDALAPGLSLKRATDLVWVAIHFRVYVDLIELGWSHERVEDFICDSFTHAVVDPRLWAPTLMSSG